ncbi:MAG: tripartite tricarboxylate transporter substrate binding protein [Burkholderiales bacterium]
MLLAAVTATAATLATAQQYPSRPIRVIVPSQAGGGADIVARLVGQKLAERWGQQVIVDNRIGVVGAETAAHAPADGYTMLFTTSALSVRESVYRKLPYNTLRDFAPVTQVLSQSNVLVVHPSVPARTVQELVALAKAKPGELNYGTGGNGTSNHLAGELLAIMTGINVVHVPYKGVPQALNDTLAGRMQFAFSSPMSVLPHVKDGRLRIIAVTTPKRARMLPDVPTIAESGVPGYEFTGWMGVLVPTNTPQETVRKLQQEIAKIIFVPAMEQRLAADAAESVGSTSAEFAAFLKTDIARWTRVVKEANIHVE